MAKEQLSIEVVTKADELARLESFWRPRQCVPTIDFDFYRFLVRTRPEIESPFVLVAKSGDTITAILVGRIERAQFTLRAGYLSLLRVPVRQLVLMDGGWMGEESGSVCQALYRRAATALGEFGLDLACVENLKMAGWVHQQIKESYTSFSLAASGRDAKHWLMRLPRTWDEFLKLRSKKHRYWIKRIVNILDKDFPGRWRIIRCTGESEVLEFVRSAEVIASETYQRGLGVGFCENEENVGRVLLEARTGRLRGYLLEIEGVPRAFWYCSVMGNTLYMSATGYTPSFRDYEVGTILLMQVFEDHAGCGVEWVDFGLGDAGYKQRFGTDHYQQNSYLLFAASLRGVLLNLSHRATFGLGLMVERLLDRLNLTQKLKTFWRRQIERRAPEGRAGSTNGPVESPDFRAMDGAPKKETSVES
jgi:hypothetical protein